MSKILETKLPSFRLPGSARFGSALAASTLSAALGLSAIVLPAWAMPAGSSGALIDCVKGKLKESISVDGLTDKTADGKPYQITSTIINAPPAAVFGIIVDYKDSGRLFKNLTKSEVVSRDEENKTSQVAFSLRGIMNMWSFDYVLAIKENFPTSIEFHRLSGAFKRNEGYWKLIPVDGGHRTEVVYSKYIDAGPMVPPQIVDKQVRDSTASVVQNLKRLLKVPV